MLLCLKLLPCRVALCAAVLASAFLLPSHACASTNDAADLEACTLTMDKVRHLAQALTDIGAYAREHPEVKASLDSGSSEGESLDVVAARMASLPEIVAILKKSNLAPRDFILVELTFVESAMAVASKPVDQGDTEYAARIHINPANLAFMRDHRAELKPMQDRLGVPS